MSNFDLSIAKSYLPAGAQVIKVRTSYANNTYSYEVIIDDRRFDNLKDLLDYIAAR